MNTRHRVATLLLGALLGLCGCAAPVSVRHAPWVASPSREPDPEAAAISPGFDLGLRSASRIDSASLHVARVDLVGPLLAVANIRSVGSRCLAVEVSIRPGIAQTALSSPVSILASSE